MEAFFPVLIFALAVLIFIVFGAISYLQAEGRRKLLAQWAQSRGLRFQAAYDYGADARFPGFNGLQRGRGHYAYNIATGSIDRRSVHAFDYHYQTESTDSKGRRTTHHHYFSAVVVTTNLALKPLSIRTEGLLDKFAAFFGFEDINFESTEFSKAFCVKSPDRRWAFDVLPQATMELLLESPRFILEFQGCHVMACRDETFSPEEFDSAIALIGGILDRLPPSVLQEIQGAD